MFLIILALLMIPKSFNNALSPLIYTLSLIKTLPEILMKHDIIQKFIWEGKTANIAQNTLIKYIEQWLKLPFSHKS